MTLKEIKAYRPTARNNFDGSARLFGACWRVYLGYLRGAIDTPTSGDDIDAWLDEIASEKVNDPESVFYIYG